jgi:uncharacterized membrane protein
MGGTFLEAPLSNQVLDPSTEIATSEDRLMPAVTYGFYLVGLFTALPILLGAIIAYVMRGNAGPSARSHYEFLINTFWGSIALWLVGGLMLLIGIPLSFVLVGIPLAILGWAVVSLVWCWVLVRLVVGSIYLVRGEAHPRPRAVLF